LGGTGDRSNVQAKSSAGGGEFMPSAAVIIPNLDDNDP
jgi:hypothetical protein